jgi:hypothetical protein
MALEQSKDAIAYTYVKRGSSQGALRFGIAAGEETSLDQIGGRTGINTKYILHH